MKKLLVMCTALMLSAGLSASELITLKDMTNGVFAAKRVNGVKPIEGTDSYASVSSDGKQIVKYSFATGKQHEVLFDVDVTQGEKISSVDGYVMSPNGKFMLIQTQTKKIYRRSFSAVYYIYTIASKKLTRLSDGGPQQMPIWSPDGMQVAFVRDNNIFLVKLLYDNAESQITKDGKFNEIINGLPDWVYEEEFSTDYSMTFTADGSMLCWIKYDESKVRTNGLQMFKGLEPEHAEYADYPGTYSYKYPKAGYENSKVSVWSYDILSHNIRKLQVPLESDGYIPRLKMGADKNSVIAFTLNRHQDKLNIYTVNPRSTVAQLLVEDHSAKYVCEEAIGAAIIGKNTILLPSDKEGFLRLYLYSMTGKLQRTIGGAYDITAVYGMNETNGDVFYQAASNNAHDRQIFVSHQNGKTEALTKQKGWNAAVFSGNYNYFLNMWSDANTPYVYTIRNRDGKVLSTPVDNAGLKTTIANYGFRPKEFFTFKTSEGVQLDGWMVKPGDFDPNKRYPVIMFQYSGPGSQQVVDSWNIGSMGNGGLFDFYLAQKGFIVVCVDGRGTGGRGTDWKKCTYQRLGDLESKDQVETALWLGKQTYVDSKRIGIWGWSFGGFNTLMSMSEGRAVFKAGVAVAPPTNWKFYDTIYTERYMRTPKENPDGYNLNPISRVGQLNGDLLLCHGIADDNVHPQNTFEYVEALVQADKDFKENLYTNRNHSIYGGNTRTHLLRQISQWFIEKMK